MAIRELTEVSRPTRVAVNAHALIHNLKVIKRLAPRQKICAMVKADAYGCRLSKVVPVLEGQVDFFGVASITEALAIHTMGSQTPCLLMQGVFTEDEYYKASQYEFSCVIHQMRQLQWLLQNPLPKPIHLWIKVNTGMHRLGFQVQELQDVVQALKTCPWIADNLGLMTHMACSDEPLRQENQAQLALFNEIKMPEFKQHSIANSAAIVAMPESHADMVRPGIMLYGVSPFMNLNARDLGLKPVMQFTSLITAIQTYPAGAQIGYGGIWRAAKTSVIGLVAVGYGDGYPRHIDPNTPVWIKGREVPIVGRVSMDTLTIDLTNHPDIQIGDLVELWGTHLLVETVAQSAGTIGYELLCQVTNRASQSF